MLLHSNTSLELDRKPGAIYGAWLRIGAKHGHPMDGIAQYAEEGGLGSDCLATQLAQGEAKASAILRALRDFANNPQREAAREVAQFLQKTLPAGSA